MTTLEQGILPGMKSKIEEYVDRVITKGESLDSFQLPPAMRGLVEKALSEKMDNSQEQKSNIVPEASPEAKALKIQQTELKKAEEEKQIQKIREELFASAGVTAPEKKSPQEIAEIKEIIEPLAAVFKQIMGSMDDRAQNTGDPMFSNDNLETFRECVQLLEDFSTRKDFAEILGKFSDLFRKMLNDKNYYDTHTDYRGSKEEELRNIEDILDDFDKMKDMFSRTSSAISHFGEDEQLLNYEFKNLTTNLRDLVDGIDDYARMLRERP